MSEIFDFPTHAAVKWPSIVGHVQLMGFLREQDPMDGPLAEAQKIELNTVKATEFAQRYAETNTDLLSELINSPKCLVLEGNFIETNLIMHGPFVNQDEAQQAALEIQVAHDVHILTLDGYSGGLINIKKFRANRRMPEDAQNYHYMMHDMMDLFRGEHGRCMPRSAKACAVCNAKDRLEAMVKNYRGPRVIAS
jgi:hypothetical protein